MKTKQQVLVIILVVLAGMIFVKYDREKHADRFEKEKISMIQKAKDRELALSSMIDSLRAEIKYLHASRALDSAKSLSDLGLITDMLLDETKDTNLESYLRIEEFYPDVRRRLYDLGKKFFNSEVRAINSKDALSKFSKDVDSAERIVPIYTIDSDYPIYWAKLHRFGEK